MSRRSGQSGYIERKGKAYYVRFWIDVPGQEKRSHKSVRVCPVAGPGKLNKSERERKAREIIAASGADTEELFNRVYAANLGVTFRQQAAAWLKNIQTRKRKPVKPATTKTWSNCLGKWLNPNLGDMPLSAVNNPAVRELVSKMADAGLSPKSIRNYVQVVKMVVASSINEHGEENYPRKWNADFLDLPMVTNQHKPTFTGGEVTEVLSVAEGQFRVLYSLLAGTGLRVGEALGLEIQDVSPDAGTIRVRQSVWNGTTQLPKTASAVREVDLHSSLTAMLKEFIGNRVEGFLFQTKTGRSISQSDILNRYLYPILEAKRLSKRGFHAFRRFRVTHLRKERVPEDLLRFWIGHADRDVTDGYSQLKNEVEFRQAIAEKVGLGFVLPVQNHEEKPLICTQCTQSELLSSVA